MAARQYQFDVGTSAVELDGTEFRGWMLRNYSSVVIYLGDANVLTTDGFPIDAGQFFSPGEIAHDQLTGKVADIKLYAIAGSASNDLRVLVPGRSDG
ncbi:hypothetical protein LCGC14_2142840 [marine sediment metagenome]|uniref:Uncharacterized protein n=1 Tax=marine sediment metagenome TaxID=412755 RepID=A0A0F9DXU9_9ZZZZ